MKANFDRCLSEVLQHEGGWADNPKDPGGATMKGVTLATFRAWKGSAATKAQLRAISDADLRAIYRRNYWDAVSGDDLPAGLDLLAFDAAVNSGPSRGAKWLQTALGVSADGKIGPATIAAAQKAHPEAVIDRAIAARVSFLRTARHKDTGALLWPTFGKGWTARVESIREEAIAMAKAPRIPVTDATTAPGAGWLAGLIAALLKLIGGGK